MKCHNLYGFLRRMKPTVIHNKKKTIT